MLSTPLKMVFLKKQYKCPMVSLYINKAFVFKIIFSSQIPMDLLIHLLGYEYCNLETSAAGILVSII